MLAGGRKAGGVERGARNWQRRAGSKEGSLSFIGMVMIAGGVCLAAAYLGPYGRRYIFVPLLGLALTASGTGMLLGGGAVRPCGALACAFFAAYLYASAAHVRSRLRQQGESHAARLAQLAADSSNSPGSGEGP